MNGHLRERPLAELIREIIAAKLSGALRLARERVQAVVYAEAGQIVFARSNLRVHRLAVCLQRWGVLAEDKLSGHVTEFMSDAEASASLVTSGALTQDALAKLLARQATDVLRPLLLWTEGEWNFDPRARLAEEVRCKLELRQLILEAARQLPAEFVAARLDNDQEIISPVTELPAHLQLNAPEGFVLSRVDAPLALGELLAVSGLPEAQARQCVYALALGGFLARVEWPRALSVKALAQTPAADASVAANAASTTQSVVEERKAQESGAPNAGEATANPRAEIDALFALVYDANYYQILAVGRSADSAEIKRAYYALAKRFHPDRFQRDVDDSLRTQIEASFMKITQAYETLRDPRARAAYEIKLGTQIGAPGSSQSSGQSGKSTANANLTREQRAAESFTQGLAALKQNNLSSAVTLLGEAARLAPQQSRYHAFYGSALARDVRTRHQAEASLQTAIKLDGNDPAYRVMLAELLRALNQLLRAERELERALALDPNHDVARRLLNQVRKAKQQ